MRSLLRVGALALAALLISVLADASSAAAANGGNLTPLEDLRPVGWTLHAYLGVPLFIFFVLVILAPPLNKRFPSLKSALARAAPRLSPTQSDRIKKWTMVALGAGAIGAYIYCHHLCPRGGIPIFEHGLPFFHILFRFALSLFPYFVGACILGGLIMKYYAAGRFKPPSSMLGAGIFASVLPVCSCGVVPLVRAMLATGQIRVRVIMTFLMVAPVLSPPQLLLSFQLGPAYVAARIVGIFVLAFISAVIIERLAGVKGDGSGPGCYSCKGCAKSGKATPSASTSALLGAWDTMVFLLPYIVIGTVLGTVIADYVPASVVGQYLSSSFAGLIISTSIGLPLFLCSGQEVLILAPLMNVPLMGANALPLGNAIAFTIAGTGICLSSIPALIPTIGRRATFLVIACFWVGSILLGLAINSLMRL